MPLPPLLLLVLMTALLAPASAAAERLDLAWFEQRADRALAVLAAEDAVAAGQAQAREARARSGWKLLGRAAAGHTSEPVDADRSRDYEFLALRLGLRYPLLGSRAQERNQVRDAETAALVAGTEKNLIALEILGEVRRAYLGYWSAVEKSRLTQAFLASETTARQLLDLRHDQGELLAADRLQALARYAAARRDLARLQMEEDLALARLNRLTDSRLTGFEPTFPAIGGFCDDVLHLAARLREHPTLQLEQHRLARQRERGQSPTSDQIDSGVGLYQSVGQEFPGGGSASTVAAVDFQMPLGAFAAGEAAKARQQARARQAERHVHGERERLLSEAESLHFAARYQEHNLEFARQRVRAAEERVRERFLRAALLEGGNLAHLQEAVFAYYEATLALLEAEHNCLQLKADLARLVPAADAGGCPHCLAPPVGAAPRLNLAILGRQLYDELGRALDHAALRAGSRRLFVGGTAPAAALTPEEMAAGATVPVRVVAPAAPPSAATIVPEKISEPPRPRPVAVIRMTRQRGLAAVLGHPELLPVWQNDDSDDWVGRFSRNQPFDSLLIALDGHQREQLTHDADLRRRFSELLGGLAGAGIRPDLMLETPAWMLPAGRPQLFATITSLSDLPFGGLHLALDPAALAKGPRGQSELLGELRNTLVGAIAKSPWPVSASLRPRELEALSAEQSLGARLETLQLEYLALLLEGTTGTQAVRQAEPLLALYPGLRFRVVQSPAISTAAGGRKEFMAALALLRRRLEAYPNFTGLLVRTYQDFQEMAR